MVVVQFHKKFVGATLCGRPSERADTQVCPYVESSDLRIAASSIR